MKPTQNTIITIFFTIGLFLTTTNCTERNTNYEVIEFTTAKGASSALIPAHCSTWEDGCSIYCRCPGQPIGYIEIEVISRCIDRFIEKPACVDDERTKKEQCNEAIPRQC